MLIPMSVSAQVIPDVSATCANRTIVKRGAMSAASASMATDSGAAGRTASDLYCIDLHPTSVGGTAVGVAELGRIPTPFGVAVTADGHHAYRLTTWVSGLPDPATFGSYATYVAWVTTPVFEPVVKLGEVSNGRTALGQVDFNKMILLVTAETSSDVTERRGPLVLRGRSRSNLMEAHDLLAQAPSALRPEHDADMTPDARRRGWARPPTYPDIVMLPGIMPLVPDVRPLQLAADSLPALPVAQTRQLVRLGEGGTLDLEAGLVRRRLGNRWLAMLAFNGQHPGPLIHVAERTTIFVNFTNRTPFPTTIHWHGVRLDNRYDGVPGVTQDAVAPGASFRYQIFFRDAGIYWYHPHHREDVQQELGLYGNMLVDSEREDYYGPVNREEVLMLDDLLMDDQGIVAFGAEGANYALMGRFGNVFLVNGEPDYSAEFGAGEVVRFFFTNVSNTRTFNLVFARVESGEPLAVKVVGSDVGKFEREEWSESIVLAPAERYVVEVLFPDVGRYELQNRVQAINHRDGVFFPEVSTLGRLSVEQRALTHDHKSTHGMLREHHEVISDIDRYRSDFDRPVDHHLTLTMEVEGVPVPVEQVMSSDRVYFNPVEWAGTMPVMNWLTTSKQVRWILREDVTGAENEEITWRFSVGDVVKIRLHNERDVFHAMQHPLHIHGQRFLVLEQQGVPNDNLVWKDTVLLPTGSTTDILLELSNPGRWMVHCHIAEHLESGMKFILDVQEPN